MHMARGFFIFIVMIAVTVSANAASRNGASIASRSGVATAQNQTVNPTSSYTYNYMYPYLNNQMRTTLKPYDATSQSTSPINAVVRTEQLSEPRRVVSRPTSNTNSARSATTNQRRVVARPSTGARAATNGGMTTNSNTNTTRRVVSRAVVAPPYANETSRSQNSATFPTETTPKVTTAARCLADYTECMNGYCERADTAYNRCYCSARLAQIDAEYQPQIETLIGQIAALQSSGNIYDTSDINEYWAETIGKYTGANSWANIDDAMNIDWASMESRVRGQNAFIAGHTYCAQHLAGCYYMASNLRDIYRSSINQDCAEYESSLERLKTVAESVIQGYQE